MHNPSSSHSISTFNPLRKRSDAPLLSEVDDILLLLLLMAPDSATPADRQHARQRNINTIRNRVILPVDEVKQLNDDQLISLQNELCKKLRK